MTWRLTVISKSFSVTIIWTAIVVAVYYAFHCVFFNTLSADLSVPAQTEYIESLRDLLNSSKFNVTPIVTRELSTFGAIQNYRDANGTYEQMLYRRLMANANGSVIELDPKAGAAELNAKATPLMNGLISGKLALIEDSSILTPGTS